MAPNCSSQIAQIMLDGMQEVIGENHLRTFFFRSQYNEKRLKDPDSRLSFDDLCDFQKAVEKSFGETSGRGILCRSGRASFKHLLPNFWKHLGMTNLQYRLMPTVVRIKVGLNALAEVLSEIYDQKIETSDQPDTLTWRMQECPYCYQRATGGPVCDYSVGILQEYLSWASSGRFYLVEEIECVGSGGSACCIRIQKKPLD